MAWVVVIAAGVFSSGRPGFKILGIRDEVARVQLLGKISSGGSTFTIANEIMPTLKQFGSVHWVKIYDRSSRPVRGLARGRGPRTPRARRLRVQRWGGAL